MKGARRIAGEHFRRAYFYDGAEVGPLVAQWVVDAVAAGYAQGRAEMAEEAARVCERTAEESKPYIGRRSHLRMQGAAAAIRALAKEPAK